MVGGNKYSILNIQIDKDSVLPLHLYYHARGQVVCTKWKEKMPPHWIGEPYRQTVLFIQLVATIRRCALLL
jgi:hypothetical protein